MSKNDKDNKKPIRDIKIDVKDFASHVDMLNGGHDKDVVFYYLKHYVKNVLGIKNFRI